MKDVIEEIKNKILKGKMDRAYDIIKSILFQNRTKSNVVINKRDELLIDANNK